MEKEYSLKKEGMATDGNLKDFERGSHNQIKKNSKAARIRRMSEEEFEREMIELKDEFNHLKQLL